MSCASCLYTITSQLEMVPLHSSDVASEQNHPNEGRIEWRVASEEFDLTGDGCDRYKSEIPAPHQGIMRRKKHASG
jgi:hypothetical protein